jgi:hypothetical protein
MPKLIEAIQISGQIFGQIFGQLLDELLAAAQDQIDIC